MKSGCIKLLEPWRLEEVDKTDVPKYYACHRMIGHPTRSCHILKDHIQALVNTDILKLRPKQKWDFANMTSCIHIGSASPVITEVEPISQAKLRSWTWILTIVRKRGMYLSQCLMEAACRSTPTSSMRMTGHPLPSQSLEGRIERRKTRGNQNPWLAIW